MIFCRVFIINAIGFNCRGIKNNFNYVKQLLQNECDILFLCEHWLKPSELHETNNMFREADLKSIVPADEILIGRPFGGVGFVCRKLKHGTIKELPYE